jgi:hypothetical protein
VTIVLKSGSPELLKPLGPLKACNGIALPYILTLWLPFFYQPGLLLLTLALPDEMINMYMYVEYRGIIGPAVYKHFPPQIILSMIQSVLDSMTGLYFSYLSKFVYCAIP